LFGGETRRERLHNLRYKNPDLAHFFTLLPAITNVAGVSLHAYRFLSVPPVGYENGFLGRPSDETEPHWHVGCSAVCQKTI
jgi:hypothetical protein